mmetsp:Transcript_16669/g.39908  ORF Transcript_16669/g.39908 Transcript_16669/m.39908 type:complete len:511 (+) Transcript_16669:16-1548(+)
MGVSSERQWYLQGVLCMALPLMCAALPPHPFRTVRQQQSVPMVDTPAARHLTHWLDQCLDHLADTPCVTWKQRYFVNASFYEPGGPVFLCVGGEGPALSPQVVVTGELHCALMVKLAQEHGALILALEHRYYGESIPTADLSTESLKFLSSRQALADISTFHSVISKRHKLPADTKWISFGGSYPGMLAAWCRSKLPHLFHAAISSSAPVVAIANMQGYNDVTASDFADSSVGGSAECLSTLEEAFADLGAQIQTAPGRRAVEKMFKVCGNLTLEDEKNRGVFTQTASDVFIPQGNDPACGGQVCNVAKQCGALLDPATGPSPLARLAAINALAFGPSCLPSSYAAQVRGLTNTTKVGGTDRVWFWQTCTEFAFYQTCDPGSRCPFTSTPHLNTLQSYFDMCELAYGISGAQVEAAVAASNAYYGGANPLPAATRILFVNGQVDPWHAQSVLKPNTQQELPAFMVPGASHHFWTHPAKPSDAPEIVAARVKIAEWVQRFLLETDRAAVVA